MHNISMNHISTHVRSETELAACDAIDPYFQMLEAGVPLGDIIWKLRGEVIEPHPEFGYDRMFSSPISQLGIPEELLIKHGLLGW